MITPIRHLWLDLEDTIIAPVLNGWFNTNIVNSQKVKKIIVDYKPDFVHLFSFAVWDKSELARFNLGTRSRLEQHFNFVFNTTWTVDDDIIPKCCSVLNLNPSTVAFSDASEFWSKHESFRLCMRHHFKESHKLDLDIDVMLLDDAVINEIFEWSDLRIKGRIVNIDNLPGILK